MGLQLCGEEIRWRESGCLRCLGLGGPWNRGKEKLRWPAAVAVAVAGQDRSSRELGALTSAPRGAPASRIGPISAACQLGSELARGEARATPNFHISTPDLRGGDQTSRR